MHRDSRCRAEQGAAGWRQRPRLATPSAAAKIAEAVALPAIDSGSGRGTSFSGTARFGAGIALLCATPPTLDVAETSAHSVSARCCADSSADSSDSRFSSDSCADSSSVGAADGELSRGGGVALASGGGGALASGGGADDCCGWREASASRVSSAVAGASARPAHPTSGAAQRCRRSSRSYGRGTDLRMRTPLD